MHGILDISKLAPSNMSVSILEIDNKVGNQQRLTFATLNPVHSLYQASHDIDKMQ